MSTVILEISPETATEQQARLQRDLADAIQHIADARAAAKETPEGIEAEALRASARAAGVGFNMFKGRRKVDGVAYQNAIRDGW